MATAGPRRRSAALAALGGCLVLAVAGCSGGSEGPHRAPEVLSATSGYEQAVVKDGASALWSFRDATGLTARDEVADLTSAKAAATVIGGTIGETTGPEGTPAAQFNRSGRVVTPISSGLSSSDAFTVELDLRADRCVSAWGRVLGTTSLPKSGREGFELLHFPKQFQHSPCTFGVEFWHLNSYLGGCHPKTVPTTGVWAHWAVVYAAGKVSCYANGVLFDGGKLAAPARFSQLGPLGIGGSGSGFQGPLDGASLAEVALYKRALTPAEVRLHAVLAGKRTVPTPTASRS